MEFDIEQIWEVYRAKLLHFVKGRVKDPDTAEDILQDVFVKTIEKIDTLQSKEKLQSWLFQITRNSIVDHYRSRKTEAELPEVAQPIEDSRTIALAELSECLMPMINKLPEHYRETIIHSEIQGKTHREISLIQKISVSGSKSRVHRGRAMLKEMLTDCCAIEFDHNGRLSDYEQKRTPCNDCH